MVYISREEALNFELSVEAEPEDIQAITKGMALYADYIKKIPVADVVECSTFMQVVWERDVAISQLAEIGKGFGEKMGDVVVKKTGKWIEITRYGLNSQRAICECSLCKNNAWVYDDAKRRFKFCPNCGARMVTDDV